jgi:uncharacterized membrane protein YhhN
LQQSIKIKSIYTIGLVAMAFYFIGIYTDSFIVRMITKPLPIVTMLVLLKPINHYSRFIFSGLLLSVIGDLLLEYDASLFIYGLIAFMLAHITYIVAFFKRSKRIAPIPLALLMIFGIVIYWLLYPGLGNMAHPVLIYIIVILIMSWRATAQGNFHKNSIYAVAGSILFVTSDSLIALNKFYVEIEYHRYLIMLSYWAAQSLMFYSAFADQPEEKHPA